MKAEIFHWGNLIPLKRGHVREIEREQKKINRNHLSKKKTFPLLKNKNEKMMPIEKVGQNVK